MLVIVSSLNLTQSKGWLCKLELYTGHESQSLCSCYQLISFENIDSLHNQAHYHGTVLLILFYLATQSHKDTDEIGSRLTTAT